MDLYYQFIIKNEFYLNISFLNDTVLNSSTFTTPKFIGADEGILNLFYDGD